VEDQRGGAAQLEPVAGHEPSVVGEVALLLGARDLGVGLADDDLVVGVDGDGSRTDLHFHGHHYCLSMTYPDRVLMGPGPSNPYPEVMQALARPVLGHLDPHVAPKVIAVVHAETSTGVRNDVATLGEGKGDALLLIDVVTSLGGIPVEVDGWGVDVAYAGTQKCLGVPPGLAPLTVSDRARERFVERSQSWYLDLGMISEYVGAARKYHHTAPVSMIYALHAGPGVLFEEALDVSW